MDVRITDETLRRMDTDALYASPWEGPVARMFRMRMQIIRAAPDERPLRALKFLCFQTMQGEHWGYSCMRLNHQWQLLLRIIEEAGKKIVIVVSITGCH